MRKPILIGLALLVVGLLSFAALAIGSAFVGTEPVEDGRSYADGAVTTVLDGYVSCFLLDDGEGRYVLVDACMSPDAAPIAAALAKRGASLDAIELVLLTHGHSDHVGALTALPGVPVRAMAAELPLLEGEQKYAGPLPALMGAKDTGVRVSEPLVAGERVQIGSLDITAFAVPGHTPGSAAFLVSGVLLLGDNATWKSKGELVGAPWVFSDDTQQNEASLVALGETLSDRAGEVRWLVPAHSGPAEGLKPLMDR